MLLLVGLTVGISAALTPGDVSLQSARVTVSVGVLTLLAIWVLARPSHGVLLIILFSVIADNQTMWWYPALKNFSSRESLLYISDKLPINPVEALLVLATISWLARRRSDPDWHFHRGQLLFPIGVLTAWVIFGMFYGLLLKGGDRTAGLWEARPFFYLPLMYVLITNLFTRSRMYVWAMWLVMLGVTIQSIVSVGHYLNLDLAEREARQDLTEHAASVPINAMIVMLLAAYLFPRSPVLMRIALPLMAIPSIWAYFLAERRSAFVGLALGVILLSVILFWLRRRAFWVFVPLVALAAVAYVAAFWNSTSPLGFPAQAVKSVIAPGQLTGEDRSSDIYRELEGRNVWFTIRSRPLTGVGYGHVFYQLYALPDISFFQFWQFMPHHSFLWIWLKTGYFGFVSMLFLTIRTIQRGVRTVFRVADSGERVVTITALLFVCMYLVFSYVDIAWDMRSMVLLALSMAICADMVPEEPAPVEPRAPSQTTLVA